MMTEVISPSAPEASALWRRQQLAKCATGVLGIIGDTPLFEMEHYLDRRDVELFVKLEAFNPGGSAKDRPALQMLVAGLNDGSISESTTVVESSSGNMGIGLAQACRYLGLPFICVVDPHAQPQNIQIMEALGAQVDRVQDKANGSFLTARLRRVNELLASIPDSFWPNQYSNSQNPKAHELGTIREIDESLSGEFDYLFVATSSTGTIQGCMNYIRRRGLSAKVVAVDAHGSVLFGGTPGDRHIPGLGAGQEPALARQLQCEIIDRVTDIDCVVGCRRAAAREALLLGGSAGGVLESIRRNQVELAGRRCVAILHDDGVRYMDTVYSDAWVEDVLKIDRRRVHELATAGNRTPTEGIHD